MAEYVERKYTAAKLSVALAIAAMLGGFAARDSSAGAATPAKGAEPHLADGSITTKEIKDHSLLFQDIKAGEIFSKAQTNRKFVTLHEATRKWPNLAALSDIFAKIGDLDAFVKLDDANRTFVKIEDANKTFVKIEDAQHQFVNGDGKVVTGFEASTGGATVMVVDVPGFVSAQGVPPGAQGVPARMRLTNLGTTPLHYGTGGGAGVIAAGASADISLPQGGGAATAQLITEGSPPTVGTLTLTGILIGMNSASFSGQILIGAGL